jgi:hypothetical protein
MTSWTPTWRTCSQCRTKPDLLAVTIAEQAPKTEVEPCADVTASVGNVPLAARTDRGRACVTRGSTSLRARKRSGTLDRSVVDLSAIRPIREGSTAAPPESLDAHPHDLSVIAEAIEALRQCADLCMRCADACSCEHDVGRAKCIRLHLGCAKLCVVANRVLWRRTGQDAAGIRRTLEACIAVSRRCGEECSGQHGHSDHVGICAEARRACEQACQALLQAMG